MTDQTTLPISDAELGKIALACVRDSTPDEEVAAGICRVLSAYSYASLVHRDRVVDRLYEAIGKEIRERIEEAMRHD